MGHAIQEYGPASRRALFMGSDTDDAHRDNDPEVQRPQGPAEVGTASL